MPDFVKTLQQVKPEGEWGFVAHLSCGAVDDQTRKLVRNKFKDIISAQFKQYEDAPGIADAEERFQLVWNDASDGTSVEDIARQAPFSSEISQMKRANHMNDRAY